MASHDPRSSSQQSLVPGNEDRAGRRRLLLVFIHGFMGDETSFRNFPAHVHNLVTITLAESHIVHTKIYPRYRSRYALELARDEFSNWLIPHEDQWTDVILLAHSMGGLIAADIALTFRHHIIGTIEFDVPFLGMHPGIVKAGLGSIFKPWPLPEEPTEEQPAASGKRPSRMNTLFNPKPSDPNFNPSFYNDVNLPVRKGWENTLYWINKHSNGVIKASKSLVQSHLEFGGAMADYRGLKARYARIRALEEDDERKRRSANPEVQYTPRIRFVNYYTASTGRPKKPKPLKSPSPSRPSSRAGASHHRENSDVSGIVSASQLTLDTSQPNPAMVSPRISVDLHRDAVMPVTPEEPLSAISPIAESRSPSPPPVAETGPELPEIPSIPQEPPFVDLAQFSDRAQRKAAEKEHDQALREYHHAVKARNKIINERSRIEEKWEKQKEKQRKQDLEQKEKQRKQDIENQRKEDLAAKEKADSGHESDTLEEGVGVMQLGEAQQSHSQQGNSPYGNYDFSRSAIMNQSAPDEHGSFTTASPLTTHNESIYSLATTDTNASNSQNEPNKPPKKKKERKFCMLPPKDASGNKDPTWVRVFMEGMDEVAAHTTLFFVSDTYEQLVGDVGARIEDWVQEADGLRAAREMEGMQ